MSSWRPPARTVSMTRQSGWPPRAFTIAPAELPVIGAGRHHNYRLTRPQLIAVPSTTDGVHTLGRVGEGRHRPGDGHGGATTTAEAGRWPAGGGSADRAAEHGGYPGCGRVRCARPSGETR